MKKLDEMIDNLEFAKKMGVENTVNDYAINSLKDALVSEITRKIGAPKKPKTKSRYIGIEFELHSPLDRISVIKEIVKLNLGKNIIVVGDSSISFPRGNYGHELRVLSKEKDIFQLLKKVDKLFKNIKAKTNRSCGLHIHIDMRNRKLNRCFKNLEKSQVLLFNLVGKSRSKNNHCEFTEEGYNEMSRGAINKGAYHKHKTIEVRLHHGTTNINIVENWVKLLLSIVNTRREVEEITNLKDLEVNNIKLPRGVKKYIKDTYKKHLKEKPSRYEAHINLYSRPRWA